MPNGKNNMVPGSVKGPGIFLLYSQVSPHKRLEKEGPNRYNEIGYIIG